MHAAIASCTAKATFSCTAKKKKFYVFAISRYNLENHFNNFSTEQFGPGLRSYVGYEKVSQHKGFILFLCKLVLQSNFCLDLGLAVKRNCCNGQQGLCFNYFDLEIGIRHTQLVQNTLGIHTAQTGSYAEWIA